MVLGWRWIGGIELEDPDPAWVSFHRVEHIEAYTCETTEGTPSRHLPLLQNIMARTGCFRRVWTVRQYPVRGHLMGTASSQFLPNYSDDLHWNVCPFSLGDCDHKGRARSEASCSSWSTGLGRPSLSVCARAELISIRIEGDICLGLVKDSDLDEWRGMQREFQVGRVIAAAHSYRVPALYQALFQALYTD